MTGKLVKIGANTLRIMIFCFLLPIPSVRAAWNFVQKDFARDTAQIAKMLSESQDLYTYKPDTVFVLNKKIREMSLNYVLHGDLKVKKIFADYIGQSVENDGIIKVMFGNLSQGEVELKKACYIFKYLKNDNELALIHQQYATIFEYRGQIQEAIIEYQKALVIFERLKKKFETANLYNDLAHIYLLLKNYGEANKYFQSSYKIYEETRNISGMASAKLALAAVHLYLQNMQEAEKIAKEVLFLIKDLNDETLYNSSYTLLSVIAGEKGEYDKALKYYDTTLVHVRRLGTDFDYSNAYENIAEIYIHKKNFVEAKRYADLAKGYYNNLSMSEAAIKGANIYYQVYAGLGDYKNALSSLLLFKNLSDSLNTASNKKALIQREVQYTYDKKAAADSLKVVGEKQVMNLKLKEEKTTRNFLYGGIFLIALFSIFMYNRFRLTRKQKLIIEFQKVEVDQQREIADERRVVAEEQKHVIEEKQKEILDSIQYAKRIQQAMLTSQHYFDEHLLSTKSRRGVSDYFIFYQPKDIVSGDFYWASEQNNKFFLITADCTGHGVPGAFMSLLNIGILAENINERAMQNPAEILNEQRKQIIRALNPSGSENSKDGMDCVLCVYDFAKMNLQFAAANNPLWLIRKVKNELGVEELVLKEYKPDKMPVGKYLHEDNTFTLQNLSLQKGDMVYTLTDGFPDQFGGEERKKFMHKRMKNLLLEICLKPMAEQRDLLESTINEWKGKFKQIDDMLVIGIKV